MLKKYLLMLTNRQKTKHITCGLIFILPYFILMALPIISFVGTPKIGIDYIFSDRLMGLLRSSVKLGFTSGFFCVIVGLGAAIGISSSRLYNKKIRWFFLAFAPIPYYIYALSYMYIVRYMLGVAPAIARSIASGFLPCVFVNVLSFLPITTGLILMEIERLDSKEQEMALMYYKWNGVISKIVVPSLLPIMCVSGMLVFVLSITDFSVPSLFQYNTFTLEIFSSYSKGWDLVTVGFISLPLVVPVFLVTALLIFATRKTAIYRNRKNYVRLHTRGLLGGLCKCGIVACILQIGLPTISFGFTAGSMENIIASVKTCSDQFFVSVRISAIAGLLAVIVTLPLVLVVGRKNNFLLTSAALLPLAMPSSLIAMGLLTTVNGSIIHNLSRWIMFPAIGCAIKYMPFVFLAMTMYQKHMDHRKIEMARCYKTSNFSYFFRIILPTYIPIIIGSFLITFLLSMGEEGVGLILMPPGYQTLAVMIYNYLHYGASQLVSGFCLLTVVITLILTLVLVTVLDRKSSGDR